MTDDDRDVIKALRLEVARLSQTFYEFQRMRLIDASLVGVLLTWLEEKNYITAEDRAALVKAAEDHAQEKFGQLAHMLESPGWPPPRGGSTH